MIPSPRLLVFLIPSLVHSQELPPNSSISPDEADIMETVLVTGKAEDLLGAAPSASNGQANHEDISQRPFLRRGEILEVVPGMIITQHSGGGKANQYFLRGFNLDHGTDFHVALGGMPVNFRSHAHGQGYADLGFLIPEFIDSLDYSKGPFHTSLGDLSTAGGADYQLFQKLPAGFASTTWGENEYRRFVVGDSFRMGNGVLTLGGEYTHEDGPWQEPDGFERFNGLIRYHSGDERNYLDITALAYEADWEASDQLPERAIRDGRLDRFGAIDPTSGGDSSRYSLQVNWQREDERQTTHADAWVGYYDLDLFSNFTYYLNEPDRGDQFEQIGKRWFAGTHIWHQWRYGMNSLPRKTTVGFQTRNDWINGIGLHLTEGRERFDTIREDDIYEGSYSLYVDHEIQVTDWFRAGVGLRGDLFYFDVESDLDANSGTDTDGILSPKAHMVFGPWNDTEIYVNGGLGFHSNDARGVTISQDPLSGDPAESVDPLVRTKGAELGLRSHLIPDVTTTLAFWFLESDSELVYVGDAGTTEAGPASERYGVEFAAYWRPTDWFTLDAEYAWSHARFKGVPSGEDRIPNSLDHMFSTGITIGKGEGLFGSLRTRYFAPSPLEESGKVQSDESFQVNARVGYRRDNWELAVDCLNVLDRNDNDIAYFYDSRLPGETGSGIGDIHLHPVEPRQFRVSLTYRW